MSTPAWRADPLTWGSGPRRFEVFLEPTCPYSKRAFGKLWGVLDHVGEDRVTLHVRLQSQPWHLFSGIVTRAIIGASTTAQGREAARTVMQAVYDHREEFEFEDHRAGPNLDATPNQILARMEAYSGVPLADAFALPGLERETVWHCKYARQNGIHVTPTFMIDGLVAPGLGSADSIEDWARKL
ncbi:MAG TPA: hypothetical protein VFN28_07595 [Amaricoccus sp.]|nr:hypothetical protein [Amaricoccus sp.]